MNKNLLNEFKSFIDNNGIILKNKTIILGMSCGVDSSILLDVLEKFQKIYAFDIVICHVNHKRRAQSEVEERFIRAYSKDKYQLFVKELDYEEFEDKNDIANFQEYARKKRMDFFLECANKVKADYLFLAHHLNDDIETSFMHLVRSSSLDSICGIQNITTYHNITVLRPFLNVLKSDIYEYAKENDIQYFEDESNSHDDYTRNRFRHNIVSEFFNENPSFDSAYLAFKEKLSYASKLMNKQRDEIIENLIKKDDNKFSFSYNDFIKLDVVMQKEVLFELLKSYNYSILNIQEIIKIINTNKKSFVNNYKDISIAKLNNYILISNEKYVKQNISLMINSIGEYQINNQYLLRVSKIDEDDKNNLKKFKKDFVTNINLIWYNICKLPLEVRTKKEGDTIALLNGHKKVKDLLIDEHLNIFEKDNSFVLLDNDKDIIAILGLRKGAKVLNANLDDCDIKIEFVKLGEEK